MVGVVVRVVIKIKIDITNGKPKLLISKQAMMVA
jgi:hypothetical protein